MFECGGQEFAIPVRRTKGVNMRVRLKQIIVAALVLVCFFTMIANLFVFGENSSKIRLAFWGTNMPYLLAMEEVAKMYNESQNKYEVEVTRQDAGNYRIWMSSQLAGGTAPEIIATTRSYANADAQNGYLYDFSEALSVPNPYGEGSTDSWKDSFAGTYLTQLEDPNEKGRFYCIPTSTVSVRIVINKEMLAENGIEIPDASWDFNDFRKICEVFEAKGITAMEIANMQLINYMVSWMLDIFLAQVMYDDILTWDGNTNGIIEAEEIAKIFLDDSIEQMDFTTNEDFKEVLEFMKMWSKYWGEGFNSRNDPSEKFLRQEVPMFFCGSWGVAGIEMTLGNENPDADQTNPYDKFDYISLPFPRLTPTTYISDSETFTFTNLKEGLPLQELGEPSGCFAIPLSAEKNGKLEGALDFLQFFTSQEIASFMANTAYEIPVVKNVEVNEIMNDFLPPDNAETIRMRFGLQGLSDGTAEEYHFKQMQMYLSDGTGSISLETFCENIQEKYIEVVTLLAEDNQWAW